MFLPSQASPQYLKGFLVAVYELIWSQFQDQSTIYFFSSRCQTHSACKGCEFRRRSVANVLKPEFKYVAANVVPTAI